MDDLELQIRAWVDAVTLDAEPVTVAEVRARAVAAPRRRPRRQDGGRGRRVALVAAAAAVLVAVLLATRVDGRPEQVTLDNPEGDVGPVGPVAFEVLATSGEGQRRTHVTSASDPDGLQQVWEAAGLEGRLPAVDFASHVVLSFEATTGQECGAVLDRLVRVGPVVTAEFVEPTAGCTRRPLHLTYVVAVDRASAGSSFRFVLPAEYTQERVADVGLHVAPALPAAQPAGVIWPHDATSADRSSPEAAARSFVAEVVGVAGADATVASPMDGGTLMVEVTTGSPRELFVEVAPSGDAWVVVALGPYQYALPAGARLEVPTVAGTEMIEARIDTGHGAVATVVPVPPGGGAVVDLPAGPVRSVVTVERDGSGAVLAVAGAGDQP